MTTTRALCLGLLLGVVACKKQEAKVEPQTSGTAAAPAAKAVPFPLVEQRARLKTQVFAPTDPAPAPKPPTDVFELVRYRAPLGQNAAYVSVTKKQARGPAIVWIAGGMDWGIGDSAWAPAPRSNDQSARAFREQGIVLMLPALRGSSGNPGKNECFLGEVDDVLAAAEYLASRPDVDPQRIYLGGHSTGATMALLVAASSARFRAVFAFGPVADPRHYGEGGCLPANISDDELAPRVPLLSVGDIRTPTLIIEGADGNGDSIDLLRSRLRGAPVKIHILPGGDHFNVLAPGTEMLARQMLADAGPAPRIELDTAALSKQLAAGD